MTTFDMVGALDKVDADAFAISNVAGKEAAAKSTTGVPELYTPNFKADAFNAQLTNAYNAHIQSKLPKPEADDPTAFDTLKAAFQSGNMIGSALSSQTLGEQTFPTRDSPELTDDQIIDRVGAAGLMPLLQKFTGVTNEAQFQARMNDIEREQKNLAILDASGVGGVAAMLAAGIVDIPTLIPIGKALQLGKAGATFLEATAKTAAAGAIDAGISEAGLQGTQQLRTPEEGVVNIASGAILGAAIGGTLHKIIGHETVAKVEGNLDAYRADAADSFAGAKAKVADLDAELSKANGVGADAEAAAPTPKSAGAAATPFAELKAEAKAHGELADAKVSAGLFDKVVSITTMPTEWLGKFLGGKTLLGQPRQALRQSPFDTVRTFGRKFYSAPEVSRANVAGKADTRRATVEELDDRNRAELGTFKHELESIFASAEKGKFRNAKDLAERAYNAVLTEGIDKVTGDASLEAVARAFGKYTDFLKAQHVANGKLPEDLDLMGADGYVGRIYNQVALRNDQGRAMSMLEAWATRRVTADVEEELANTQYTERLAAHEASAASHAERMDFWQKHPERLKDWENRRDIALAQDKEDYKTGMASWRDRTAEHAVKRGDAVAQDEALFKDTYRVWEDKVRSFLSDPANDGKAHPFMAEKPKRSDFKTFEDGFDKGVSKPKKPLVSEYAGNFKKFEDDFGPRPRKGAEPLVTEGNAKPAVPRGKYGVPMLREHIPAYSKALAQDVYDTIAGVRSSVPTASTSRARVRSGYLHGRVIDIPDEALAENFFLKTNLLEIAELMHQTSGRQAAFGSVFKTVDKYGNEVGDYTGHSVLVDIEKEAKPAIDAATGAEKTRLIEDRDKYMAGVKNEMEHYLGAYDGGNAFGLLGPKAANTMAAAAYAVRLGGVTVSSLTDAPKIAISQGLGNTFAHGILPMLTDFRATMRKGGIMREQGIRTGTVAEALHATRLQDAFELNNPHQIGDKWSEFVNKATQMATQMSLISYWTDFMKQVTHNVVSSRILKYSSVGHDRLSKKNQTWLANIGIEAHDLRRIGDEYGKQDLKHVAGVLYADVGKWADQDVASRFQSAMRREGRNTIVTPGFGDRPQFTYDATGKLMYQFQSFMLIDQTRFVARQVQLANVGTDASEKLRQQLALGAGLSSLVMAAVMVDAMKRALRDNDASWDEFTKRWQDNPGGSMYDAVDRSGLMGSLFGASNTVGKFSNGQFSLRGGTQWLAGDVDRGEARKVRDIGLGGVLLGPGAGMVEDLVKTGQAAGKVIGGGDLNHSDLRRFQNLLPYHSVPGIQQGMNAVNELSAGALGMPQETPHLAH